jgi:hypothetical protein
MPPVSIPATWSLIDVSVCVCVCVCVCVWGEGKRSRALANDEASQWAVTYLVNALRVFQIRRKLRTRCVRRRMIQGQAATASIEFVPRLCFEAMQQT